MACKKGFAERFTDPADKRMKFVRITLGGETCCAEADTFFIGQTHDALQVAAVSLATPVFRLFMAVGTAFGIGGTSVISRVLVIGIPAALGSMLMSVSQILINSQMKEYGDMAIAGMGVAMKVVMLTGMVCIGLGQGIQPILGFCVGAKLWKRFQEVLRFSLVFSVILGIALTTSSLFGIFYVLINTIQAMGAATASFIINLSRQGIIFIPALLIMKAVLGLTGLIWAQPIADIASILLAAMLYVRAYKNLSMTGVR